jgi:hypothetical protein
MALTPRDTPEAKKKAQKSREDEVTASSNRLWTR